jgi:hypothetical protein
MSKDNREALKVIALSYLVIFAIFWALSLFESSCSGDYRACKQDELNSRY